MADELELLEQLTKDFGDFKTKSRKETDLALKEAADKWAKEHKDEKEAFDKQLLELSTKVKEANEAIAAKGATVDQLMGEIEEFKKKKGRIASDGDDQESTINVLKASFKEQYEKMKEAADNPRTRIEWKIKSAGTMTASANLTGSVVASYASQPALRGRQKLHFRDLVDVVPTGTGLWKFYRQNIPVGEGSIDTQSTHGAVKSQLDYDFTEVTVTVDYLAGFVRVAKQMIQDLPFMQSFVTSELVEDYLRAEDLKFFGQLYSAATGSTAGMTSTVTVEKIIQGIATLSENDYDANGVVLTNAVWSKVLLTKPNDYSLPGGNAITIAPNGDVRILGIPLFRTKEAYIGAGRMIIGDWSKVKIIQSEGLNVNIYEQDSDNVQRNLVTVKAEARVAEALLRPDAFIYAGAGTT